MANDKSEDGVIRLIWIIAGAIIATLIGLGINEIISPPPSPANLVVSANRSGDFQINVRIENDGEQPAKSVTATFWPVAVFEPVVGILNFSDQEGIEEAKCNVAQTIGRFRDGQAVSAVDTTGFHR